MLVGLLGGILRINLLDQVLGFFGRVRLLIGDSVSGLTTLVCCSCTFVLANDRPEILQQVFDAFLLCLERVLQVIALQQHQQSLQIDDHFRLRTDRVAQFLVTAE